jgi:Asp-tRNA(Asn)/Glu-tRNA(Gln) amidotransferase A subunit family amidase
VLTDLTELSAREVVARIHRGSLTAEAVTRAFLARIEAREPAIGAWAFLDPGRAIAEAKARDQAGAPGPLAGVTIGVKDVIETADMPTGYGSAAYAGFRPAADAPCVCLSRAAGAVALGKTVSTEFAMAASGKTRNPYNGAHTPGGSSSGSAAAIAARMAHIAFGTQTSGSVIRPAAYCGIVGYKPSFGMLDRTGIKVLSGNLDTLGIMARDVRDVAFFTAVLASRSALQVPDIIPAPRIGLFRSPVWDRAEPATVSALDRAVATLGARGVTVADVHTPKGFEAIYDMQDSVMGWEVTRALAFERLHLADRIAPKTRDLLQAKSVVTLAAYDKALADAAAARSELDTLFGENDVLLTPAAPGEAPEGLQATGNPIFNRAWTLLHVPCVAVPAGFGPNGLPVGVQIVGRIGADARVLAVAAYVEDALAASSTSQAMPHAPHYASRKEA